MAPWAATPLERRPFRRAAPNGMGVNAGEMLVTDVVRQLVEDREYLFSQRGEANLKGFKEPVRLFEVLWA